MLSTALVSIVSLLAQTPSAPANGAAKNPSILELLSSPIGFIFPALLLFMWFSFSAKRKQDRERKNLLANLKKGDRVRMVGGELGSIVEVSDDVVLVKVDESSNTKIRYVRDAIAAVVEPGKSGTAMTDKASIKAD
ncbi:MAG: preprotein translocase subunit YajC [Tepidisphaeraceae bacterium]